MLSLVLLFQKIISRCGCFFHPDRPPVIYQVEIGKVVEKADSLQQKHLPSLSELSSLYSVQVNTSTHWSAKLISTVPDSY
ncbi:uncharacterized protein METZ01_LOCUS143741, partial [marine metagenome]